MRVEVDDGGATEEEVAAITAAVEALWPKPVFVEQTPRQRKPAWRFSNRWWMPSPIARRDRPQR
jgi:hypothetical protein